METKQVPVDGGLHFNVVVEDDGHVTYTFDTETEAEVIAQYCPDTKELTLFKVTSERQATDVVKTQLNQTVADILGKDPMLAALAAIFGGNALKFNLNVEVA